MTDFMVHGVYSFADAARLTGLKNQRISEWFVGRKSEPRRIPLFKPDHDPIGKVQAVSFHDLLDVFVAGHLREFGVSMPTIRKVYTRLQKDLKVKHPFAHRELLTDGERVFVRGIDSDGEEEIHDALSKQKAFPKLILPFLNQIDYDRASELALRWNIAKGVVIDPRKSFGKPVLKLCSVPTYIIAAEYRANAMNADRVADWYNITPADVLNAVHFESGIAA